MKNKRQVLITGGSRGIGRAIANACASDGHDIVLVARAMDRVKATAEELRRRFGVTTHGFAFDAANVDELEALRRACEEVSFLPDVLVLNAGIFIEGNLLDAPVEDFSETLRVNFLGAFHAVRTFRKHLESKPSKIILIASSAAREAYPVGALYGVAKWALRGLSVNLREEFKQSNVSVNTIYPGGTLTDLWEGEELPPNRLLAPEDIGILAAAIIRLSDQAVVEDLVVRPILGDIHD